MGVRFYRLLCLVILASCWLLFPTASQAKKRTAAVSKITNLASFSGGKYTRFVIHIDKIPEYSHGFIPANEADNLPSRIYVDLARTEFNEGFKNDLVLPSGPIMDLRFGKQPGKSLRLVLDLKNQQQYKVTALQNPSRLAIDLYDIATTLEPVERQPENFDEVIIPGEAPKKEVQDSFLIVIDPGHGGDDTGAVGPTGLQEKNLVLELALALRDELLKDNNIDVLLTRDRDRELELKARSNFANVHKADLFISIHSNASTERNVGGFSTYYLNNTSDRFSQRLAAVENNASTEELAPADLIVNDLKMNKITLSSQKLAEAIQGAAISSLSSVDPPIKDHGVLTALFYVLLGARMPAALVECNFISNPVEESLLADPSYREKVVSGIATGIRSYLKN